MRVNKIWLISDTHLGHRKLIEICERPKNFGFLILNNLDVVHENDILIHIGDVSFYNHLFNIMALTSSIAGKKWLIRGNHDDKSINWYCNNGWDFVGDQLVIEIYGLKILFTHKPSNTVLGLGDAPDINIHGHLHIGDHRECDYLTDRHILISLERLNYKPVQLKSIVDNFLNKQK